MKRAHYSKPMLRKQDCVKFGWRIAWQSFFENRFADFSDVVGVKKKHQDFVQPLVAFPISNISYWDSSVEPINGKLTFHALNKLGYSR